MQDNVYSFWKVDDFFATDVFLWNYIENITSFKLHTEKDSAGVVINSLEVNVTCAHEKKPYVFEIEFWSETVFRVRFNPECKKWADYPRARSQAISKNKRAFQLKFEEKDGVGILNTPRLELRVDATKKKEGLKKVRIHTYFKHEDDSGKGLLHTTSNLSFRANYNDKVTHFHVVQSVIKPPEAQYIGFGEQGGAHLVKNEEQVTYFNYDNMRYKQVYNRGPMEPREPMYHSEPFWIEFNGSTERNQLHGCFIDNPGQVMVDIGYVHSGHIMFGSRFGGLDYYIIAAQYPRQVTTQYAHLIGTAKLKPRYSLGYHQGCYGYDTRDKVINVVEQYRNHDIPLDGMHIDVDMQRNYKTFTIDTTDGKFGDPEGMFRYLRSLGVMCSTNITPIISNKDTAGYSTYEEGRAKNFFVIETRDGIDRPNYQDFPVDVPAAEPHMIVKGQPYMGEVYYGGDRGTTGHYPNFARKEVREWWGRQYSYLMRMGLEFVWQDMTTPAIRPTRGDMKSFPFRLKLDSNWLSDKNIDQQEAIRIWNLYSFNLHHATYKGLLALPGRENIRPFIIGRGAFAGVHKYAGLWNGDNSSSWDFFNFNIHQCLALGISSMSLNGQDIGGFEPENNEGWADPQLLTRWTAAGAFLPWFRNHYNAKASKLFQEPFKYKDVNLDEAQVPQNYRHFYESVYPVCQYYIKLRYRLMQVFYDALFENQYDGLPISRALILNDVDDALYNDKARFLSNQFFLRDDLLVAPIVHPEIYNNSTQSWEGKRDIYFPASNWWYQFMDNKKPLLKPIRGGSTHHGFDASISSDPAHIPFILPLFVRAGAILPTIEQESFVGQLNKAGKPNPITFNIYPGAYRDMYYKLYLDDGYSLDSVPTGKEPAPKGRFNRLVGRNFDYDSQMVLEQNDVFPQNTDPSAQGKFRRTLITHRHFEEDPEELKKIVVVFEREVDNYKPREDFYFVALLHKVHENNAVKSVTIENKGVTAADVPRIYGGSINDMANRLWNSTTNAWYYNSDVNISFVKIFDTHAGAIITANK